MVRAIQAANRIHRKTYIWGGGHRSFKARGYDCSGAVSYVLHAAGVLSSPLVSGQLAFWGMPGPGAWITVFANKVHTYMYIAGLRYDTSPRGETVDQGRGPRWRYTLRTGSGFAVRHYPGSSGHRGGGMRGGGGKGWDGAGVTSALCEYLLTEPPTVLVCRANQTPSLGPDSAGRERGNQAVGANPPMRWNRESFSGSPSANPVGRRRRTVCGQKLSAGA